MSKQGTAITFRDQRIEDALRQRAWLKNGGVVSLGQVAKEMVRRYLLMQENLRTDWDEPDRAVLRQVVQEMVKVNRSPSVELLHQTATRVEDYATTNNLELSRLITKLSVMDTAELMAVWTEFETDKEHV